MLKFAQLNLIFVMTWEWLNKNLVSMLYVLPNFLGYQ